MENQMPKIPKRRHFKLNLRVMLEGTMAVLLILLVVLTVYLLTRPNEVMTPSEALANYLATEKGYTPLYVKGGMLAYKVPDSSNDYLIICKQIKNGKDIIACCQDMQVEWNSRYTSYNVVKTYFDSCSTK